MARALDNGGGGGGGGLGGFGAGIASAAKSIGSRKQGGVSRGVSAGTRLGISGGKKSSGSKKPQARSSRSSGSNANYRAPAPTRYAPPRPSVGNSATGRIAPASPAPAPAPMTPDQWLSNDTSYKSQRAAYEDALRDYATQYGSEQNKYNTEFAANQQKMMTDRTQAQTGLTDDYASRGLMNSGVYGDALNTFQSEWDTKAADMERAKQAYMNDLLMGKSNFEKEQSLYLEKAKQDALNRMSAGVNI